MSGIVGMETHVAEPPRTVNTTARVPGAVARALDEEARRTRTSRASVIRMVLSEWAIRRTGDVPALP